MGKHKIKRSKWIDLDRLLNEYSGEPDSNGCWPWFGPIDKDNRAKLFNILASRLIWNREHGPIPEGLFVCHACDNPNCVNPDHLWLGTHLDNMADMRRKGRARGRGHNFRKNYF